MSDIFFELADSKIKKDMAIFQLFKSSASLGLFHLLHVGDNV